MKMSLTAAFVDAVKPPERGQMDYWDQRLSGFGLRVSEGGRKSWVCFYRHSGQMRRFTLGSYPTLSLADARQLARSALRDAQHGLDPARMKQETRSADSFGELASLYLERHAKINKRSWPEDERILNRELLPAWKNRKAGEIVRKDVIALLDRIVERGAGVMANRVRALISKLYNFAIKRGIVDRNPASGVGNPGQEHQRDRVLTEDEIRAFWTALEAQPPKMAALFKLLLLTVQRRSEVAGMRWDKLDLNGGWWTIAAERSKNRLSHRVPLGPQALAILRTLEAAPRRDPIFVFRGGNRGQPVANLQKPMQRIKEASKVDFKIHDLRRSGASLMTGIGVNRLVVSKLLNHAEQGVTAVYDRHGYDAEKRAALIIESCIL